MKTTANRFRLSSLSLAAAVLAAPMVGGCLQHPVKQVEYQKVGVGQEPFQVEPNRDVDILFVIDNSGSMGEEQALLSANFEGFIAALEAEDVKADYRIAVTTTDVSGSIYCYDTTPEDGAFVMSTCHDRIDEFVNEGQGVDVRGDACESLCPAEFAGANTTPTELEAGGDQTARPWIQNIAGGSNLPEGMSTTQAFQCFGPQGIAGCGMHESPLEAMNRAILRSKDSTDPAHGFIRDNALFAVVFITDENECSVASDFVDIFNPTSDRTFWENPESPAPTSAVCWNAGVQCDGSGACTSQDHAVDGSPTEEGDKAVLYPLERYSEALLAAKGYDPEKVLVSLIAGVPLDYPNTPIAYGDAADPDFQASFGVEAGCVSEDGGTATPPVRLKEFADEFLGSDEVNVFSVCADDYSPALENLANKIRQKLEPACMNSCVADQDPGQPGIQTDCVLKERSDAGEVVVPECELDGGAWTLPADAEACYYALSEADDAFAEECVAKGSNVEFQLVRKPGTLPPSGSHVFAECVLSEDPGVECPGL